MNIDCEKIIKYLDDSEYKFRSNYQKVLILKIIQHIFCEILIGGRNNVYTDSFFKVTNIRKNVQNYSSEFDGLIHKMVSKEPFINQEIIYINGKDELELYTVSDYIKYFLSIREI